jgi:hypothetical protein
MPSFLSGIDCRGTNFGFQILSQEKRKWRHSSQVNMQAKKLELHLCDHSSVQDDFRL